MDPLKANQKPDPEMLKELDILLNMDELGQENDWETVADLNEVESEEDHE